MNTVRRILITGAGSGIGLETALQLSRMGHEVIAGIRNPNKFQKLWKSRGEKSPPPFKIARFDVTSAREVKTQIARELKNGPIHTLINNAGYGLYGCFEELPASAFQKQMDTNLQGILNVTKELLPSLRSIENAQIINVSSILGRVVLPTGSAYCTSKWAVSGFTKSLRYELVPLGIQVCAVEPGLIRTEFKTNMQVPSLEKLKGPYGPYNRMIGSEIKEYGSFSTPAFRAGQKIAALVQKRNLPGTYRIGTDAKLVYAATKLIPESWLDLAFRMGTKRRFKNAGMPLDE
ncbi:MAG: SDR family oxidoreductase [Leptospiraceae bacterium]